MSLILIPEVKALRNAMVIVVCEGVVKLCARVCSEEEEEEEGRTKRPKTKNRQMRKAVGPTEDVSIRARTSRETSLWR